MILCIENLNETARKLLELINECSKVAGYKIKKWNSLACLCSNNEKTERDIKETVPLIIAMKRIKTSRNTFTLRNKRPIYRKHYTNRWRNIPCSMIGRINIAKISILPKAT